MKKTCVQNGINHLTKSRIPNRSGMDNQIKEKLTKQEVGFRKPLGIPRPNGNLRAPQISRIRALDDPSIPSQAGCSTLGAGGYRNKVVLKPGHSALDWSELANSKGKRGNLITGLEKFMGNRKMQEINHPELMMRLRSGIPPFMIFPRLKVDKDELMKHVTREDCWTVIKGNVYCLTPYLDFHPGGVEILMKSCAGKDGTVMFNKYHRWVNHERLLETCLVGVYV